MVIRLFSAVFVLVVAPSGAFVAPLARSPAALPHTLERSRVLAVARKGGNDVDQDASEDKPKMSLGGLFQLITMGAGAPSLGEFKEWDGTKAMFELEANNFADADGNVRRGRYVDDGYVDSDVSDAPPNFFANLMSGGRLQREYTDRMVAASAPPKNKKSSRR